MNFNKSPQRFYKRRGGVEVIAGQTLTVEPGFLNPHQPVWRHGPYDGGARFVNQQDAHKFCFDLSARQAGVFTNRGTAPTTPEATTETVKETQ